MNFSVSMNEMSENTLRISLLNREILRVIFSFNDKQISRVFNTLKTLSQTPGFSQLLASCAQDHVYWFLVEDAGKIVYVGKDLPAKYASGTHVKLGSRALIPAFGDSHIHFASFATFHAGLNVSEARSNAEILHMIREFVPKCNDKLVIAFGASIIAWQKRSS